MDVKAWADAFPVELTGASWPAMASAQSPSCTTALLFSALFASAGRSAAHINRHRLWGGCVRGCVAPAPRQVGPLQCRRAAANWLAHGSAQCLCSTPPTLLPSALQSCLLACPLVSLGATAPCVCRLMTPPHCPARSLNTPPAAGQQLQPGHPLGIYVGRLVPDAAAHLTNDQVVSER